MKDKIGLTIIYKGKQVSKVLRYSMVENCVLLFWRVAILVQLQKLSTQGELYNNSTCN